MLSNRSCPYCGDKLTIEYRNNDSRDVHHICLNDSYGEQDFCQK